MAFFNNPVRLICNIYTNAKFHTRVNQQPVGNSQTNLPLSTTAAVVLEPTIIVLRCSGTLSPLVLHRGARALYIIMCRPGKRKFLGVHALSLHTGTLHSTQSRARARSAPPAHEISRYWLQNANQIFGHTIPKTEYSYHTLPPCASKRKAPFSACSLLRHEMAHKQ